MKHSRMVSIGIVASATVLFMGAGPVRSQAPEDVVQAVFAEVDCLVGDVACALPGGDAPGCIENPGSAPCTPEVTCVVVATIYQHTYYEGHAFNHLHCSSNANANFCWRDLHNLGTVGGYNFDNQVSSARPQGECDIMTFYDGQNGASSDSRTGTSKGHIDCDRFCQPATGRYCENFVSRGFNDVASSFSV